MIFLGGWAFLETLTYFGTFIIVFATAGILAFLLDYPVTLLAPWVKRVWAGLLVYGLVLVVLSGLFVFLGPLAFDQAQLLAQKLPETLKSGQQQAIALDGWLQKRGIILDLDQIQTEILAQVSLRIQGVAEGAIGFTLGTFGILLEIIVILVLSFYMLLDGGGFWRGLMRILPSNLRQPFTDSLRFNLRGFFAGQLILGAFMAVLLTPIYWLLGSPFPLLLALFIGFMELIPFVGASIGIGSVVLLTLLQNFWLAVYMLLASVIAQQIKDNIVAPRVLGNFTGLNPILIFGALLLGVKVGGLLGVILAIPFTGVLKSILEILFPPEPEDLPISVPPKVLEAEVRP